MRLAAYMRNEAPPGSVLYHYWLGYHYRFYLYGAPLRLHWYPDLEDLARDATIYRREPRYIAFPSWRDGVPAQAALASAGINLAPVLRDHPARRQRIVSTVPPGRTVNAEIGDRSLGIEALKRLLSPEYLVVAEPGPMGGLWVLYLALGLLFAAGLASALWVLAGARPAAALPGAARLGLVRAVDLSGGPGHGGGRAPGLARLVGPHLALLPGRAGRRRGAGLPLPEVEAASLAGGPAPRPGPVPPAPSPARRSHGAAATARQTAARQTMWPQTLWLLLGLAVHLAGIAFVLGARYRWPLWAAPLVLLLLLAPQAPLLLHRQRPRLMALTPLFGAYAAVALWLLYRQAWTSPSLAGRDWPFPIR